MVMVRVRVRVFVLCVVFKSGKYFRCLPLARYFAREGLQKCSKIHFYPLIDNFHLNKVSSILWLHYTRIYFYWYKLMRSKKNIIACILICSCSYWQFVACFCAKVVKCHKNWILSYAYRFVFKVFVSFISFILEQFFIFE